MSTKRALPRTQANWPPKVGNWLAGKLAVASDPMRRKAESTLSVLVFIGHCPSSNVTRNL